VFASAPASATVFPGVNVEQINGISVTGNGTSQKFSV